MVDCESRVDRLTLRTRMRREVRGCGLVVRWPGEAIVRHRNVVFRWQVFARATFAVL